jgi:O-antigen/teichoic acid export membrane protein
MPLIKNIIFVYVRMLLIMFLSLITSSFVFKSLGVNDYGLYNVVGGVVIILAFLNNAMVATTQRYLSVNLSDRNKIIEIFRISKTIHLIIAIIVLIIAETVGLYFVNNFLNFEENRINAVNVVYQFSLLSMLIMIINVPYMSIILVNQRMSFYALVGVIDAVLKFILAFGLFFISWDKLIIYSMAIFFISVVTYSFYYIYAIKEFKYIKKQGFIFSLTKMKNMMHFASWNLLGVFAGLGQNVGVNILLNVYFRTEINASRALSLQIYNAINNINSNTQVVYSPLIIRKYAEKEDGTLEYVYLFSKLSFFVISFVLIPVYFYLNEILKIWIENIPDYLNVFLKIMFMELLFVSLSGPLHSLIQGTGNIKWYQIIVSSLLLLNIPIGLVMYHWGSSPDAIYYVSCILTIVALFFRISILGSRKLMNVNIYFLKVIFPILMMVLAFLTINYAIANILLKVFVLEIFVLLFAAFSFHGIVDFSSLFLKVKEKFK